MSWIFLLSLPILTAFIGWMTNLVAIRMLFRPMEGIRILGYTWQGIIPKRQKELATRTAAIIERELLDSKLLEQQIRKIDLKPYLNDYAKKLVHEGLGAKLRRLPLFGNFADSSALIRLEKMLTEEMQRQTDPLLHRLSTEVGKHIPVRELVEEKIRDLDVERLEQIVNQVAKKEFKSIELLGGVLGFIVGLLQLLVLYLTGNLDL